METFSKIIGAAVIAGAIIFFAILVGSLLGALIGWVIGLIFGKTILGIFAAIGITGFKMWQIGAFLGFVGGFFKSITNKSKE